MRSKLRIHTILILKLLGRDAVRAHVGAKGFWNDNASVGLLVVFEDGEPGAAHGQGAAVEGVDKFGLSLPFRLEADVGAPGLE